jgi:N-acetylmuramic acid 6-phosphate etherase
MSTNPQAQNQTTPSFSILETEKVNPATTDIDRLSPLEIVQVINAEDAKVASAVQTQLTQIARAIEEIAARLRRGGRLIYAGAGTSGRLGALDASECPPTFNVPPEMVVGCMAGGSTALMWALEDIEDRAEAGQADMEQVGITEADALVAIAASGYTPYALGAVAYAKKQGALTIGLACNKDTALEKQVDIMIAPVVGPEVITGSTRLKAGTAQKMVLNMLSTGTMILLGKTFGNLMVDVQASNRKLRQRALKIVQLATGLDQTAASELLEASGGEAKTAILAARAKIAPESAREKLAAHSNILRAALEDVE